MLLPKKAALMAFALLIGGQTGNSSAPCPLVYPWAELRVTPKCVQFPAQGTYSARAERFIHLSDGITIGRLRVTLEVESSSIRPRRSF